MRKMLPNIIEINDELCLKILFPKDAEKLFSIANNNRSYFARYTSWINKINTIEDEEKFIENALHQFHSGSAAHYGIYYDNEIIGAISFNSIDNEKKLATIGYWLDPKYQKKGYMDLSLKAILTSAKETIELLYFIIETDEENLSSRKLAERNEFRYEAADKSKLSCSPKKCVYKRSY